MSKKKTAGGSQKVSKREMTDFELSMAAKNQFVVTTMNMSWQLAIVVLVPIIGGYYLDEKMSSGHLFFIVGFILALIGMVFVVWRQISLIEPITKGSSRGNKNV